MNMLDALTAVLTDIGDDSVSTGQAARRRYLGYSLKHCRHGSGIGGVDLVRGLNVLTRNYKNVYRSLRAYIFEGVYFFVLIHLGRRDLSRDYFAKKTRHFVSSQTKIFTKPFFSVIMDLYKYILSLFLSNVNKEKENIMPNYTDLWSYLSTTHKKIVMYGMGNGADKILSICRRRGIEVCDFFASDGFVRGHEFHGKRVLSYSEAREKYGSENMIVLLSFASSLPDVLENIYRISEECELYAPDVPVCGTTLFDKELYDKNIDKIRAVEDLLCDQRSKEVYRSVINYKLSGDISHLKNTHSDFSEVYRDILKAERFKSIADLGAYNGDTLREIKPFAKELESAIAFEPDRRNHKKLCEYSEREGSFKIEAHKLAAWSHRDTLIFDGSGNRNSTLISSDSIPVSKGAKTVEVEACSLDLIARGRNLDYIKYDVEGSEKEALDGSHDIIKACAPALMISLYHRSEDIYEIPLMIHQKYPEYKLYIRRREYVPAWDTVLLAVREGLEKFAQILCDHMVR